MNIKRIAGDTYPIVEVLKIDGVAVDLAGWTANLYYREVQEDGTIVDVKMIGTTPYAVRGEVKFFPRKQHCRNVTDDVEYDALTVTGSHEYSIVRTKEVLVQDVAGEYVMVDGVYVVYDVNDATHSGLTRYTTYFENMTHVTGNITISDRAGL